MTEQPVNTCATCGKNFSFVEEIRTRQYHIDLDTAAKHGYINPLRRRFTEIWADGWTLKHTHCTECDGDIPDQESRNFAIATAGAFAIYAVATLYTMITGGMVVDPINLTGAILILSISTAEAVQAYRIHTSNELKRRSDVRKDHNAHIKKINDEPTKEELRERFAAGDITQDEFEQEVDELANEERDLLSETH